MFATAVAALAQMAAYSARPIRVIVPFPAGGAAVARAETEGDPRGRRETAVS